jgi:ferrous iron transport protein A
MNRAKSLAELEIGRRARVCALLSEAALRRRLLDMGLICDTEVECLGSSPLGDPRAYLIRGAVIAIRNRDSKEILIAEE